MRDSTSDTPTMLNEYRIEKDRVPVLVSLVSGARISGTLFVQPYMRHRYGREDASDVLNSREPFFPLATEDGETVLVAKEQVADVEVGAEPEVEAQSQIVARSVNVEVTTAYGAKHNGTVYLEVRNDRPRLLDFLNQFDHRFLSLHTGDGVRLLNRTLIEQVRPVD